MAFKDIFRVTIVSSFKEQIGINVLHYYQKSTTPAGPPDTAALIALAGALAGKNIDEFKACLSQEARYEGVVVRYVAPTPAGDLQVNDTTGNGPGLADGAGISPTQVAGLIRKRGVEANRRNRGRFYMPFAPANVTDNDDFIQNAYFAVLEDLADSIKSDVPVSVAAFTGVLSPCLIGSSRTAAYHPIVATSVARGFATQKRRGYFGKPNQNPLS